MFFKTKVIPLKKNCLITRRPLILISGPKSPFYFKNTWGLLAEVIYEHGYKVKILDLPFTNIHHRQKKFKESLPLLNKAHLIFDQEAIIEFENFLALFQNSTLTTLTDQTDPSSKLLKPLAIPQFYFKYNKKRNAFIQLSHHYWLKLHQYNQPLHSNLPDFTQIEDCLFFIDHCVKLAELDYLS